MAYPADLIQHAIFLSKLNSSDEPKQADLRRAVSAAYYGLLHLLTTEAARNWKHQNQRDRFARMFEHGRMRNCSSRVSSRALPSGPSEITVAKDLRFVAASFVELQQARHAADYDNAKIWSRKEVLETIKLAEKATAAWSRIREEEVAQEYLLDLIAIR